MFVGMVRGLPRVEPEMPFTWVGSGLPTKIRIGSNGLPGTNALAYYKHLQITVVKSFITLATGVYILKLYVSIPDTAKIS
jgi:hypothetical protein